MDAFIKQKVITPKVPSSFNGDRKQSNFVGTAKNSAKSSVVDAGTTPRTEKSSGYDVKCRHSWHVEAQKASYTTSHQQFQQAKGQCGKEKAR